MPTNKISDALVSQVIALAPLKRVREGSETLLLIAQ
jgi:hypothetical protein